MRRAAATLALTALAVTGLTGCGIERLVGVKSVACASWVGYESDEQRFADADAVVVVTDIEPDGTVDILGYDAHAYTVRVIESEKGDFAVGDTFRVGSTADGCGIPYEGGDQMLAGETLRLYLSDVDGGWRTLTPFDGAQVVEDDGQPTR